MIAGSNPVLPSINANVVLIGKPSDFQSDVEIHCGFESHRSLQLVECRSHANMLVNITQY